MVNPGVRVLKIRVSVFQKHIRRITSETFRCLSVITEQLLKQVESQSGASPSASKRHFYDGHDHKVGGSTPTQASLLRPWVKCFTA